MASRTRRMYVGVIRIERICLTKKDNRKVVWMACRTRRMYVGVIRIERICLTKKDNPKDIPDEEG